MNISLAEPNEAATVHQVLHQAFAPLRASYTQASFDATVLDPQRIVARMIEGPVWLARSPAPVGTVSACTDDGVYVRGMAVVPEARGQGLGESMLQVVEDFARAQGQDRLWLRTTPFLQASRRLYERAGFVDIQEPADLHGTPLITYEKRLPSR